MKTADLRGRRVAILGLGREGMASYRYLRRQLPGQPLWLLDEKRPADAVLEQFDHPHDRVQIDALEALQPERFDIVVKSPGISPLRAPLATLDPGRTRITSGTNLWFAGYPDVFTVAVTGTKGKSTTAALIHHLLRALGLNVALAGNVGRPLLDLAEGGGVTEAQSGTDGVVVELSSYQLADFTGQADIGVLLNLFPEHLDWHGDLTAYEEAKWNLVAHSQQAILGPLLQIPATINQAESHNRITRFGSRDGLHPVGQIILSNHQEPLVDGAEIPLKGEHNLMNLCAAMTVLQQMRQPLDHVQELLADFQPLAHRLQYLGRVGKLDYVDDSISTTPQSSLAAWRAYAERRVALLLGGFERGVDWQPFADAIVAQPPFMIVCLPDNGHRIHQVLTAAGVAPEAGCHLTDSLADGMALARQTLPADGLVLLSPGAPSYGQFRNFEARGRQFAELAGF